MVDRVQVVKWESTSGGGSSDEPFPTEINPNEDGIEVRTVFLQDDSSDDENVKIDRVSGEMTFRDEVVTTPVTLEDLSSGGGSDDDQVKDIVELGDTFTVKADHQHIVWNCFTIDGSYVIEGTSVIFD